MRLQPWHDRRVLHSHEQWFKSLVGLHELTSAWLRELQMGRPTHVISRGVNPEVAENLWMLDSLSKTSLEDLLDDTLPEDTLGRLEHTIWAVQAWTLIALFERSTTELPEISRVQKESLKSILEQVAWKQGKLAAETEFPDCASYAHPTSRARRDLRELLETAGYAPVCGFYRSSQGFGNSGAFAGNSETPIGASSIPSHSGFLVKRAVPGEILFEMISCAHQIEFTEVRPVEHELCLLHMHWLRGFLYAFDHRIVVEQTEHPNSRCVQRWFLTP
jgi:hypothetical protein